MERMKKKRKKVINTDTGMIFDSVADAVAYYGEVTKSKMNLIRNCCSGKGKTAIGYHWAYYEEAPITEGLSDI